MAGPRFTLVFNGDIRDVKGNIFKLETPFGKARAASVGDALETKDDLLGALKGLLRVCPAERHGMRLPEYEAARTAIAKAEHA